MKQYNSSTTFGTNLSWGTTTWTTLKKQPEKVLDGLLTASDALNKIAIEDTLSVSTKDGRKLVISYTPPDNVSHAKIHEPKTVNLKTLAKKTPEQIRDYFLNLAEFFQPENLKQSATSLRFAQNTKVKSTKEAKAELLFKRHFFDETPPCA